MATLISGKEVSAKIRRKLSENVNAYREKYGTVPGLAVVIVGEDPASQVYVRNKHKACAEVGMYSEVIELSETTTEDELLSIVHKLNDRQDIHGILVQLPLPAHLSSDTVIANIKPEKDVDAFHTVNVGKIMLGKYDFLPCTPAGVMALLADAGIDPAGKECVVVGRSNIVGKPMAMLLLHENATVTVCHSKTRDLPGVTRRADILVVAVGRANFIRGDMIKEGAVVIDVGMNRRPDGKLTGDVNFEECEKKASYITPVPGGVGPMTITMLLQNTLKAAELSHGL